MNRRSPLKRGQIGCLAIIFIFAIASGASAASINDVTEKFPSQIMYPNIACEQDWMGVFVDLDGKNNPGSPRDPQETMVTFYTARGQASGIVRMSPRTKTYYFSPHTNGDCNARKCTPTNSCPRGRVAIGFVDMTASGFNATKPSTWKNKGMDAVSFSMFNDGTVTTNSNMPYQQAKAYSASSAPRPPARGDLIDMCNGQSYSWTSCKFTPRTCAEEIYEIWVTTDYAENVLDDIALTEFVLDPACLPPPLERFFFPPLLPEQPYGN